MFTKEEALTLANLGDGAAVELFDTELSKVLKNIMDPEHGTSKSAVHNAQSHVPAG